MADLNKRIAKMRGNPRDWRIEDLKVIADSLGIEYRSSGGSHVVFRYACCNHITVPAKRPIKPIYITKFLELVDGVMEGKANENGAEKQI
jgi:hypothetical protein